MKLQIVLITLFNVGLVKSLTEEVFAYLGEDVTLRSDVNQLWSLSKIDWSIFSNTTWIATYRDQKTNVRRVDRYQGRLILNTSSGDLTIRNVNMGDVMKYKLEVISTNGQDYSKEILLSVKQKLQPPTINAKTSEAKNGGCWVWVNCSSTDKGVKFTWNVNPPNVTIFTTDSSVFTILSSAQQQAEFICKSSRDGDHASSSITPKCDVVVPEKVSQSRSRLLSISLAFCGGFLTGVILVFILARGQNVIVTASYQNNHQDQQLDSPRQTFEEELHHV